MARNAKKQYARMQPQHRQIRSVNKFVELMGKCTCILKTTLHGCQDFDCKTGNVCAVQLPGNGKNLS